MMTYREVFNTYNKAIELYGEKTQKLMAIEEMSELTKEICKDFRGKLNREHLVEEMADVLITIEQLAIIYEISDVAIFDACYEKIERLKERLEKQNDEIK